MSLRNCSAMMSAAKAADFVIAGFVVADESQALNVLSTAMQFAVPMILEVPSLEVARKVHEHTIEARFPIGLQLASPKSKADIVSAFEAGVSSFAFIDVPPVEMIKEIHARGMLAEAHIPFFDRKIVQKVARLGIPAVHSTPGLTYGAFTGRPYVLLDELKALIRSFPRLFFSIAGTMGAAHDHVKTIYELPISKLEFDVSKMTHPPDVMRAAVENLGVLNEENTVTMAK